MTKEQLKKLVGELEGLGKAFNDLMEDIHFDYFHLLYSTKGSHGKDLRDKLYRLDEVLETLSSTRSTLAEVLQNKAVL